MRRTIAVFSFFLVGAFLVLASPARAAVPPLHETITLPDVVVGQEVAQQKAAIASLLPEHAVIVGTIQRIAGQPRVPEIFAGGISWPRSVVFVSVAGASPLALNCLGNYQASEAPCHKFAVGSRVQIVAWLGSSPMVAKTGQPPVDQGQGVGTLLATTARLCSGCVEQSIGLLQGSVVAAGRVSAEIDSSFEGLILPPALLRIVALGDLYTVQVGGAAIAAYVDGVADRLPQEESVLVNVVAYPNGGVLPTIALVAILPNAQ